MNYYRLHIGDYLRDTAHLSLLEHGVYARLLQVYYTREGPICEAERYRVVGARTPDEREAVDAVLAEFFVLVDGAYTQSRCDREIAEYQSKAERNREVGRLGGRPVTGKNPQETQTVSTQNPDETLASSQEPIAKREEKERENRASSDAPHSRGTRLPDGFPGPDEIAWCRGERQDVVPQAVAARFRDYWAGVPGAKGRKADWPATWRNFVRSERPQTRASPPGGFMRAMTAGTTGAATSLGEIIDVEPVLSRLA